MAKKIKLSKKTESIIVQRLKQFCNRYKYISSQNFYNSSARNANLIKPKSGDTLSFLLSPVMKSFKASLTGERVLIEEIFDERILVIESDELDCREVFHYGDTFEFSPTQVKIRTLSPGSFWDSTDKCTTVFSIGNPFLHQETLADQELDREEMMEAYD